MRYEPFYQAGTRSFPNLGIYAGWIAHATGGTERHHYEGDESHVSLILSGECFSDESKDGAIDLNWIVQKYARRGAETFAELNGLFSGLLVDDNHKRAFLFNDRYGMERLYYYEEQDEIYFASEAKALLQVCPAARVFDEKGVADYLTFGCTTGTRTLFRGVSLLPAGSVWTLTARRIADKYRYFSPDTWEAQEPVTAESFELEFAETFQRIVPRYAVGEGLGVSLTAGLDTRMILAACPAEVRLGLCYTYDGPVGETRDTQIAVEIAEACDMEHKILRIETDFFSDFASHADRTVFVTDGTFGVLGAHERYLSAKARFLAPTRLTGVFGSEIMRGVSTFKPLRLSPRLATTDVANLIRSAESDLKMSQHPITRAAFAEIPWNIFGSIAACRSQLNFRTPYLDNELVAFAYRTPAIFRASAQPAISLIRRHSPVLATIPTDMGAGGKGGAGHLWRRVSSKATFKLDYISNEGLPDALSSLDHFLNMLSSRKIVFGHHKYLRYRSWLRKELASYLREAVAACSKSSFYNADFIGRLAQQHISGARNYIREINAILTLDAVERTLIRAPRPAAQDEVGFQINR